MISADDQILKERAKKVAHKAATAQQSITETPMVEFLLFPERYAVDAGFVREVLTIKEITPVPGLPDFVIGVINFRGTIISIINLKILFGLKAKGLTEMNKAILLRNDQMEFGLIADGIIGSVTVALDQLSAPPLTLSDIGAEFMTGLTKSGAIMLDAARMLECKLLLINQ